MRHIHLHELALACFAFDSISGYNDALAKVREETDSAADLTQHEHRTAVLKFLRRWGCRHLAVKHQESQLDALRVWYGRSSRLLPGRDTRAWDLSDKDLDRAEEAFDALKEAPAHRTPKSTVRVGPTAAAKVLYVLRPHAFPPPDDATVKRMKAESLATSYREILSWAREQCRDLARQCERHGFGIEELPTKFRRRDGTVIDLVQEYMWVRFTRKVKLPTETTLREWTAWAADRGR